MHHWNDLANEPLQQPPTCFARRAGTSGPRTRMTARADAACGLARMHDTWHEMQTQRCELSRGNV
eukprot:9014200-Lingulodinium_polyedra.AAC.1